MTNESEVDQATLLRGILESVANGELSRTGTTADSVAQLLAAAIAQVGQSLLNAQNAHGSAQTATSESIQEVTINPQEPYFDDECDINLDPQEDSNIGTTVEVLSSARSKPICIKFPIELRKQIIAMRKDGKKCKQIAKELKVSVSGVQKVWERFLATGMVHDRKPSAYAGRPRKYVYSQDSPSSPGLESYVGDGGVEYVQENTPESQQVEYVYNIESGSGTVLVQDGEVYTEEPMDVPGATVEIVETTVTPTSGQKHSRRKGTPAYREQLLLRLIEECPLAMLRELPDSHSNQHIQNLSISVRRPLYMEYVLGHPFGKAPSPVPFDANCEEAKVVLSDPVNPLGKDLLAALGYSTKVYFNACCKPSPLFDLTKVCTTLPFSYGPGHIVETMQAVLQIMVNLCHDPITALQKLPKGNGPAIVAHTSTGEVSQGFPPPTKLSEYWLHLYHYATLLNCCENFLSATIPSAPCLLCHPFESFAHTLEIKDPEEEEVQEEEQQFSAVGYAQEEEQQFSAVGYAQEEEPPMATMTSRLNQVQRVTTIKQPTPLEDRGSAARAVPALIHHPLPPTVAEEVDLSSQNRQDVEQESCSLQTGTVVTDTKMEFILPSTEHGAEQGSADEGRKRRRGRRKQVPKKQQCADSPRASESEGDALAVSLQENSGGGASVATDDGAMLPPAKRVRKLTARQKWSLEQAQEELEQKEEVGRSTRKKPPVQWSVEEVADFITSIDSSCTYLFREHEVDGGTLVTLDPEIMVKLMGMKTGPAMRIHKKIQELNKRYGSKLNIYV
ncbi:hypothetical protein EMCRGX_G034816 [Ephydatia muelleri]